MEPKIVLLQLSSVSLGVGIFVGWWLGWRSSQAKAAASVREVEGLLSHERDVAATVRSVDLVELGIAADYLAATGQPSHEAVVEAQEALACLTLKCRDVPRRMREGR